MWFNLALQSQDKIWTGKKPQSGGQSAIFRGSLNISLFVFFSFLKIRSACSLGWTKPLSRTNYQQWTTQPFSPSTGFTPQARGSSSSQQSRSSPFLLPPANTLVVCWIKLNRLSLMLPLLSDGTKHGSQNLLKYVKWLTEHRLGRREELRSFCS